MRRVIILAVSHEPATVPMRQCTTDGLREDDLHPALSQVSGSLAPVIGDLHLLHLRSVDRMVNAKAVRRNDTGNLQIDNLAIDLHRAPPLDDETAVRTHARDHGRHAHPFQLSLADRKSTRLNS